MNLVSLAQPQWPWSRKGSQKLEVQCQCLSGLFFLLSLPLTHLGSTSPQSCKYNTFLTLLPEVLKWSCLVTHWSQLNKKRRGKLSIFVRLKYHWQECVLIWTPSPRPLCKKQFPNASSILHLHAPAQIIPLPECSLFSCLPAQFNTLFKFHDPWDDS